jgi:hypothetical protein
METSETETLFSRGLQSGSAVVGALVAIIFLTIVTVSMVKSTRSQAVSTASYNALHTSASTVSSGIIATETQLRGKAGAIRAARIMDSLLNNPSYGADHTYLIGTSASKFVLAENQSFHSRMLSVRADSPTRVWASFNVRSGVDAGRKRLKSAHVFGTLGNVKVDNETPYGGGKNAIYLGGSLSDGNNGMIVDGHATIRGNLKVQNHEARFLGTTWVGGWCEITTRAEFVGNTYIHGDTKLNNVGSYSGQIFRSDAGFNGTFSADNATVHMGGNIFMNGNLINPANIRYIEGPGNTSVNYFSGTNVGINSHRLSNFRNVTASDTRIDIPGRLGMSLAAREEPTLDMRNITASGVTIYPQSYVQDADQLSTEKLNTLYETARTSNPPNLYNGHVVVRISSQINCGRFTSGTTFNNKVIFIVDGEINGGGGRFYNSGPESSTLVYVSPTGRLQDFGSSGPFQGLIYVDKNNTREQRFQWGTGSSITGAVHMLGSGNLSWNTGGTTVPTIKYDEGVLNAFGGLREDAQAGAFQTTFLGSDTSIIFNAVGFYYY